MMWVLSVSCLLLCVSVHMAHSESTQRATTTTYGTQDEKTTSQFSIPEISGPGATSPASESASAVGPSLQQLLQYVGQPGRETEENNPTQATLTGGTSTRAPNTHNGTSQTNSLWTSIGEKKGFSASTGRTETKQTTMAETNTTISDITDAHETTETEEKNSTQTTPTEGTTAGAPYTHNSTSQNESHATSVGHGTEGSSGNWSTDLTTGRQETNHTTVTETNTTSSNVVHTNGPTSLESNNTQTQSNQVSTATVTEENNSTQPTPTGATSTGAPHTYNGSTETSEGQATDGTLSTQSTDLTSGRQESNHTTMTRTNTTSSSVGAKEGHKEQQKKIIISVLVGASAVTVFVALLLRRSYFQKKTINDRKPENVYESIEDVRVAANESQYEAIYVLAGDPAIVNLGKKIDTEPSSSSETQSPENQGEPVYYTIQADEMMLSDVSPIYSRIQHV